MNRIQTKTDASALTQEQWAGLATLGQAINGLSGPLSGPATAWIDRAMAAEQRDDLGGLLGELIATGVALRDSGLLALLREQAPLIVETLRALGPLVTELQQVPVNELLTTLSELRGWIRRLEAFAREHLAEPATRWTDEAAAFAADNDLDGTLRELLQTLSRLHRNGTLAQLRELSDMLADSGDNRALASAAGQGLSQLREGIGRVLVAVARADRAADGDSDSDGGVSGLFHLLRDPDVQHGLRLLALLPGQLRDAA